MEDLYEYVIDELMHAFAHDPDFKEDEHPRDDAGKFAKKLSAEAHASGHHEAHHKAISALRKAIEYHEHERTPDLFQHNRSAYEKHQDNIEEYSKLINSHKKQINLNMDRYIKEGIDASTNIDTTKLANRVAEAYRSARELSELPKKTSNIARTYETAGILAMEVSAAFAHAGNAQQAVNFKSQSNWFFKNAHRWADRVPDESNAESVEHKHDLYDSLISQHKRALANADSDAERSFRSTRIAELSKKRAEQSTIARIAKDIMYRKTRDDEGNRVKVPRQGLPNVVPDRKPIEETPEEAPQIDEPDIPMIPQFKKGEKLPTTVEEMNALLVKLHTGKIAREDIPHPLASGSPGISQEHLSGKKLIDAPSEPSESSPPLPTKEELDTLPRPSTADPDAPYSPSEERKQAILDAIRRARSPEVKPQGKLISDTRSLLEPETEHPRQKVAVVVGGEVVNLTPKQKEDLIQSQISELTGKQRQRYYAFRKGRLPHWQAWEKAKNVQNAFVPKAPPPSSQREPDHETEAYEPEGGSEESETSTPQAPTKHGKAITAPPVRASLPHSVPVVGKDIVGDKITKEQLDLYRHIGREFNPESSKTERDADLAHFRHHGDPGDMSKWFPHFKPTKQHTAHFSRPAPKMPTERWNELSVESKAQSIIDKAKKEGTKVPDLEKAKAEAGKIIAQKSRNKAGAAQVMPNKSRVPVAVKPQALDVKRAAPPAPVSPKMKPVKHRDAPHTVKPDASNKAWAQARDLFAGIFQKRK